MVLQCDDLETQQGLQKPVVRILKGIVGDSQLVIIDEAQDIPNIGASLKLLVDTTPNIQVVVSGSSAFELNNQVGEPLVGRSIVRYLLPISMAELTKNGQSDFRADARLDEYLLYGMYPEVLDLQSTDEKKQFLQAMINSQLLRDVLKFKEVKGSYILVQLLSLLAYQVGSLVSHGELANKFDINKQTVARYIDLLQKSYIIFRLGGYSRNLRN